MSPVGVNVRQECSRLAGFIFQADWRERHRGRKGLIPGNRGAVG